MCIRDRAQRTGVRIVDLLDREVFASKVRHNLNEKNDIIQKIYGSGILNVEEVINSYIEFDKKIDPYITDTTLLINEAIKDGKRIYAEGAQGALLDVDHGTYPFVTSSNPTSGGACTGLGIPPQAITRVIGVVKAYTTRVGNGPFPTELINEMGETLRRVGAEFGATTGRPRRCGWLDLVALKYSVMINGIQDIALTKLDVLDELEELYICTSYMVDGKPLKSFPSDIATLEKVVPVYKKVKGWNTSLKGIKKCEDLPQETLDYFKEIEGFTGARVAIASVSPHRDDTIICH